MLKSRFALKTSLLALLRVANAGLNILVLILLARTIGSDGVGIYSYVVVLITVLLIPLSNGAHTLVLKLAAEATAHHKWSELKGATIASVLFAIGFALSVGLILAVIYFGTSWLPAVAGSGLILALAFVLLFDGLSAVRSGFMRGLDYPLLAQMPELVARPAILLVCLGLLYVQLDQGLQTEHALYALLLASFVAMAAGFFVALRHRPAGYSGAPAVYRKDWLSSSASFASKGGIAVLNNYVDILLLGILLASSAEIGIYRVAAQIAVVSGIVYVSINALATQTFAVQLASDDIQAVRQTATQSARLAFLASLPLPVIMLFFGAPLIGWIFGPEFAAAAPVALVLLVGQMINAGFGTVASLLTVANRGWTVSRWFAHGTAANVVLCFALIPVWGMMGAAIANVSAGLLFNLALWALARRELRVDTSIAGTGRFKPESQE
jgi:O-antigen/teichoic acid export membrane protein